jgi:hypothetical protein
MTTGKSVIGPAARVKGRIFGEEDLDIEGRVEGEVQVSGDVLIEATGLVAANVSANVITVRGAVRGDLVAREAVRLEDGARVVGDLRAPRIAIAPGALVRGHVQTGSAPAETPAARRVAAAPARVTPAARPAPAMPVRAAAPAAMPVRAAAPAPAFVAKAPAPKPVVAPAPVVAPTPAGAPAAAAPKAPPPPVVPALKKGAKGAMNKKKA